MKRRKHIVRGILESGDEVEFNGCGWSEPGRGKRFSRHDADMAAFDVNCEGVVTAWRVEVV